MLEVEVMRAFRYHRPMTVGMVDIDHFKQVNDEHGHLVGDAILKKIAATLKSGIRATDAIGRYGGEEFLFFLPETDLKGAVLLAEKLRDSVEGLRSLIDDEPELGVTVSIGLTELAADGERLSPNRLIGEADANLLTAKQEGRNRVVSGPPS